MTKPDRERRRCIDCRRDTFAMHEYYSVRDDVWAAAVSAKDAEMMVCIDCLEGRLGRRLVPDDFTDAAINTSPRNRRSPLLLSRMGRDPDAPSPPQYGGEPPRPRPGRRVKQPDAHV